MRTVSKPAAPPAAQQQQPAIDAAAAKANDDFLEQLKVPTVPLPESIEGIDDDAAFDLMETVSNSDLAELTGAYWTPSPGSHVFKFISMTTVEFDGKTQEAVTLQDRAGITYTAAQAVLVSSLKKVTELPCFVKVICDGSKRRSTNGQEYFNMQVLTFPAAAIQKL